MHDASAPRSNLKQAAPDSLEIKPRRLRWYFAFVVLTTLAEAFFVAASLPLSLG
jgi:hypothetical protein